MDQKQIKALRLLRKQISLQISELEALRETATKVANYRVGRKIDDGAFKLDQALEAVEALLRNGGAK